MLLIYFLISICFFYFLLKKLINHIDLFKCFKTYIKKIKSLNIKQSQDMYIKTFDNIAISGAKLFLYIFIYLTPSIPVFYLLSITIISILYILFFKFKL